MHVLHTRTHAGTHVCTHARTHTHMHTHTHTHTVIKIKLYTLNSPEYIIIYMATPTAATATRRDRMMMKQL